MIIKKRTLKIKCAGLFLSLMMGMNVSSQMICVDWEQLSDGSYKENSKCFYETGDGSGDYCIESAGFQVGSTGRPCGPIDSGCGENMTSFWVYAGSGNCTSTAVMAIFPISDTYIPFILLLGVYGFSIYYRKKKR